MKKTAKQVGRADIERLYAIAKALRRHSLDMIFTAQAGHIGGCFSLAEILACLYYYTAKVNPNKPDWPERDRILISKGHCCPIYYATLAEKGFFSLKALETFDRCDSILQGHPDVCTPGVDMPSGSLGMGLSVGVGLSLAARLKNKNFHTYVVLGDGELQSGEIWEAAMSAAKYNLGNLTAIIDNNQLQVSGFIKDIMPIEPLKDKWRAFNWHVLEVDGHNIAQILKALEQRRAIKNLPVAIIAKTVKGKGVSFMENSPHWHARVITRDEYDRAILEIGNE